MCGYGTKDAPLGVLRDAVAMAVVAGEAVVVVVTGMGDTYKTLAREIVWLRRRRSDLACDSISHPGRDQNRLYSSLESFAPARQEPFGEERNHAHYGQASGHNICRLS